MSKHLAAARHSAFIPSPSFVRECFNYDPATGALTWRERPASHFKRPADAASFNTRCAGQAAGTPDHGYLRVRFTVAGRQVLLYVHRVAWCLIHGEWPDREVDHWDLDGINNRAANLRLATHQQNQSNSAARRHNRLGVKGVQRCGERFAARITINRKTVHLGRFGSAEEAASAFAAASQATRGEFARTGRSA